MLGQSLLNRVQDRDLITPYLDFSMSRDNWPEKYSIEVDSSPWDGDGDPYFHPSSHAIADERFLYYQMLGKYAREPKTLNSAMTLSVGTAMHAVVGTQLIMSGLCTEDDLEVPVIDDANTYRGHLDALIHHPNGKTYVCDIKTMYSGKYRRIMKVQPEWDAQVNLYMAALEKMGIEVADEGIVLAIEIGWPYDVKEFRISRDDDMLQSVFDKWGSVRDAVAEKKPPAEKCCLYDSTKMNNCPARDFCKPQWGPK